MREIHCLWEGPLTVEQAIGKSSSKDYGVYALYGSHSVLGSDSLLYVGQANGTTFSARIRYHWDEWIRWEPSDVTVYLGRLGGWEQIDDDKWGVLIDETELLLIFFTSPPYNSSRVKTLRKNLEPTLIINHRRRHRIPQYISNLIEKRHIDDGEFKEYGESAVTHPIPPKDAKREDESVPRRDRGK